MVFYTLAEPTEVTLDVLDRSGTVIRSFSSEADNDADAVPNKAGMNRFVWDLEYAGPDLVGDEEDGPTAVPGTYQARLTAGEGSQTQSFDVLKDPRLSTTEADFQDQFDLLIAIRDKLTETHDGARMIRSVRTQAEELADRLTDTGNGEQIGEAAGAMNDKLTTVEEKLLQTETGSRVALQPKLTEQFGWLYSQVGSADAKPTDQSHERFDDLSRQLVGHLAELQVILNTDLAAFNEMIREQGVPPVIVPDVTRRRRAVTTTMR
jgi:hypothetical protein